MPDSIDALFVMSRGRESEDQGHGDCCTAMQDACASQCDKLTTVSRTPRKISEVYTSGKTPHRNISIGPAILKYTTR